MNRFEFSTFAGPKDFLEDTHEAASELRVPALTDPGLAWTQDQAIAYRVYNGFSARMNMQFFENIPDMVLHSVLSDEQYRCDLAI